MKTILSLTVASFILTSSLHSKEKPFDTGIHAENVKTFMAETYLNLDQSCLNVKTLDSGGNATESIFLVNVEDSCGTKEKGYIVKSLKSKRIMANGRRVNNQEIPHLEKLIQGRYFDDLPNNIKVILPEAIFIVGKQGGTMKHTISEKLITSSPQPQQPPTKIEKKTQTPNEYITAEQYNPGNSSSSNSYVEAGQYQTTQGANPTHTYVGATEYVNTVQNKTQAYESFLDPVYIEIMPLAKGKEMSSILLSDDTDAKDEAIKAYAYALALLHQKFMDDASIPSDLQENQIKSYNDLNYFKSMIHGDPHWGNVFYDSVTKKISFIDNESFAESIEPKTTIIRDLDRLTFYATSHYGNCFDGKTKPYNQEMCLESIPTALQIVKEYINNYPEKLQTQLKTYIRQAFKIIALVNPMKLHRDSRDFLAEQLQEVLG